ncbi:inorganic phosphate transporter [Citreicella sp. C3M06]|nr:inorganic phosphate transporter [Citreicella sp. C3M06]MBU2962687.1 inorganic phosphate transporter [Citreicella sp. C3M06]
MSRLEAASLYAARPLVGFGVGMVFIAVAALAAVLVTGLGAQSLALALAAGFAAFMALSIGANDVANNMGPAVGARALSMGGAIAIAAICESAGALLAGGEVVTTVSTGIFDPAGFADPAAFVRAMLAALLASAIWVNVATFAGAPVSTTHALIGGVVGAGLVAGGPGAMDWPTMAAIALSWVVSPLMGGAFAAAILAFVEARIVYVEDKIAAAKVWVPVLIGVMAAAFAAYLALKGLSRVIWVPLELALAIGAGIGLAVWAISVPLVRREAKGLENRNRSVKRLFRLPLVISGALLSFAHGANDVANAVGPLAAVVQVQHGASALGRFAIPDWVMLIGALGISVGLVLFGPRLIGLVGNRITKLNPIRAYCVALSAAVTVIAAAALGLPVSSTHIAIGGIFGVGFYREFSASRRPRSPSLPMPRQERARRRLVRRSHFLTIIAAWVITVPAAGAVSAALFWALSRLGFMV